MEQPNLNLNSGSNAKKNILLWFLVVFAALAVVFFSASYVKKIAEKNKAAKQQVVQEEKTFLGIKCDFANDEAAYKKAIENAEINTCDCISDENLKKVCKENTLNLNLYNQAIKQYDPEICNEIKEDGMKQACLAVVESGINNLKEKDPQSLADIYAQSHNRKAIAELEKLIQQNPANLINLLNLALVYAETGLKEQELGKSQTPYVEKALAVIEKSKNLYPNNSQVYRVEGYIYEIKPDIFKAMSLYDKAIELDSNNILAYIGRGHAASMVGILEKSLEDFKKAAELDVNQEYISIYANLCRLQASLVETREEAIKNCKIAINTKDTDNLLKAETYQTLAGIYIELKKYSEAQSYLLNAKSLSPNSSNLYVIMAKLSIAREKYSEAQQEALKAIELSPTKAASYETLAYALYRQEKYEEAIDIANRGLDLIDGDVSLLEPNKQAVKKDIYYVLANIYNRMEDKENEMKYKNLGDTVFDNLNN